MMRSLLILPLAALMAFTPNYDEKMVPDYTLPDPLQGVSEAEDWPARRAELLAQFESRMYGVAPGGHENGLTRVTRSADFPVLNGKGIGILADLVIGGQTVHVLIVRPAGQDGPVPVFLGLNFCGNHVLLDNKVNPLPRMLDKKGQPIPPEELEKARGSGSDRWPLELIIGQGHAVVTAYYGEIDPDFDDGFRNGVHGAFPPPGPDGWGSIAAWAWGLSRIMDGIEKGSLGRSLDPKRVAVIGHSRLGKTALWAGARDERFALVVSNNSGCGGAALSRRAYGETVERINTNFPHWFCGNFKAYNGKEGELPFDQHQLLALIAPRPVYVASAVEDRWADPRGEFLSCLHASPVYELLGRKGVGADTQPPTGQPLHGGWIAYHLRPGKHEVTEYDWKQYLTYAKQVWRNR